MNVLTSATRSTQNKAFLVISEHAFKLLRNVSLIWNVTALQISIFKNEVLDMSIHIKFYKEHPGVAQIYLFK